MDLGLDDDRREFREAARGVLAKECPSALTRGSYDDPQRWRGLWQTCVDLGWTAIATSDDGGDVLDLVLLHEQAGSALVPAPLLSTALAAGALRAAGAVAGPLLAELAAGSVGALAAEPTVDRQPGPCAIVRGDRITGTAGLVRDAARADLLVVVAVDDTGREQLAAVRAGPGVEVDPAESVDPSAPVAAVSLDVTAELVVPVRASHALAVPLVVAAAELVGVAQRALDLAVTHAAARRQFGQPIGAFQAVKHRLADTYVGLERARSIMLAVAERCRRAGPGDPDVWQRALLAKAAAGDAAAGAARGCVATHGAIAQTWEHDAHLLLRRAWLASALLGSPEALYLAAARDHVARAS